MIKKCPHCSGNLLRSSLEDVYACNACKNIFTIKRVVFEQPQADTVRIPPVGNPPQDVSKEKEKGEYKPKDLTSIPKPIVEQEEEKGEQGE